MSSTKKKPRNHHKKKTEAPLLKLNFGMVAMMAVVLLFMIMHRNPAAALMPRF